jgi:hypothetical protein
VLLGFVVGFGYSALRAGLSVCCECPRVRCVGRAGAFNSWHAFIPDDSSQPIWVCCCLVERHYMTCRVDWQQKAVSRRFGGFN